MFSKLSSDLQAYALAKDDSSYVSRELSSCFEDPVKTKSSSYVSREFLSCFEDPVKTEASYVIDLTNRLDLHASADPLLVSIKRLPDETRTYIFKAYLETDLYSLLYDRLVKSAKSCSLNISDLRPFIPYILAKTEICVYISEKCFGFRSSYREHKVINKKMFRHLKRGDSFTLSILMYLYH